MEEKLNLMNFKSLMDSMLSTLDQMNGDDKTAAFSLLKNYVSTAQVDSSESNSTDQNSKYDNAVLAVFSDVESKNLNVDERNTVFNDDFEKDENPTLAEENIDFKDDEEVIDELGEEAKLDQISDDNINTNENSAIDNEKNEESELLRISVNTDSANITCTNCSKSFLSYEEYFSHLEFEDAVSCKEYARGLSDDSPLKFSSDKSPCKKKPQAVKESLLKTCPFCPKTFYNAQHFDRHVSGHKRNNCSICSALFTNRKHLETHMLEVHDTKLEKNYFECKFCFKKLSQKRSILKHYKTHHFNQCSVCTICGKFFDSANELDKHLLDHENKKYTCEPCKQTFIRHQQYIKHLNSHNKYFCITCDKGFASLKNIASHSKLGHTVKGFESVHKCNMCDKIVDSKDKLAKHLKTHKEKEQYYCKCCEKSFNKASYYKQHQASSFHKEKMTSSVENSVRTCHLCSKSFSNKTELLIHSQEFHGIFHNILRCPFCTYKTKQKANMKRHVDLHMQQRKYVCDQCGTAFYTYSCMKEHIICAHSTEKNFSCEKCGMAFKLNSTLRRHMATHSEERTKKCHCGQAYKLSTNLTRHQLLVHGKVDSPKNFQRLSKNEFGEYIPVPPKKKRKNVSIPAKPLQVNPEEPKPVVASDPLPLTDVQLLQPVQVIYQNLDFAPPTDNKQPLMYTPSVDIAHLYLVETMLQAATGNETLKQPHDILVDPTCHNIFDSQIADSEYLANDASLSTSIEMTQITNLSDLTSHSSQIPNNVPISNHSDSQQILINSLNDYVVSNQFPFLNV